MTAGGSTPTAAILSDLRAAADPHRAAFERAYLKSGRDFLGVSVPATRKIVRAQFRTGAIAGREAALATAETLWDGPVFECRRAAVEVLAASVADLDERDLTSVEAYVRDGETWAIVDPLAIEVAGRIVARGVGAEVGGTLDRWATDADSFWVRRLSLLALLPSLRASSTEWNRFVRYADTMLPEKEFFIRKAIGWVAREVATRRPDDVRAWAEPRWERMSGVTRREVERHL